MGAQPRDRRGSIFRLSGLLNNAVHHVRCGATRERAGLGQCVRHQPHRTVRADRSPHPASPRRLRTSSSSTRAWKIPSAGQPKMAGFRGSRYISAEASARGEWEPGGSKMPGADAYATSKQCNLATALEFAREIPRLRFNAVEPGFNPATGLGARCQRLPALPGEIRPLCMLAPHIKYWSTPQARRAHRSPRY